MKRKQEKKQKNGLPIRPPDEIPTEDAMIGMIYTAWSRYHRAAEWTEPVYKMVKSAAIQARLEALGYVKHLGMTVDEAMVEVRDTMYPVSLIMGNQTEELEETID